MKISTPPVVLDIETGDADDQYDVPPDRFYRLGGAQYAGQPVGYVTDPRALASIAETSALTVGHNALDYDLPLLDRARRAAGGARLDYIALARDRRILDTMVTAATVYPPPANLKPEAARKLYKLDSIGPKLTGIGKSDDLPALAKEHGGYGRIPLDDPRYRAYLAGDLQATQALASYFLSRGLVTDYVWREQRVAAIAGHISSTGFRVDDRLLEQRFAEGQARKAELIDQLVRFYGLPLTDDKGVPFKSPAASKNGKAALIDAFARHGIAEAQLPHTPKGAVSFKGETMLELGARHPNPAVKTLCEAIAALVGVRTVYQTLTDHLADDGRVHPSISMFQASGRWSTTDPGLTVLGKRGGRVRERAVLLPDDYDEVLVAFDLAQVDARAVAVHSQDHNYLDMFLPGKDMHAEVAKMVWGEVLVATDPAGYREQAKPLSHGYNYLMGEERLSETAGVSRELAHRFHVIMRQQFARKAMWNQEVTALAKTGAMLDNGFGRKMRCTPGREHTQGPALMGQGATRDIVTEGMLRIDNVAPDVARMIRAQVHDELVFSIPRRHVDEIERLIVDCMSFDWAPPGASRPVHIPADKSKRGDNWAACYAK
jgi:DNA polymerase-1